MAWIPPAFLNSTVALGVQSQGQETQYIGTGFMYGYPTGATDVNGHAYLLAIPCDESSCIHEST